MIDHLSKIKNKDTKLPVGFPIENRYELFFRNKEHKANTKYDPGPNSYNPN